MMRCIHFDGSGCRRIGPIYNPTDEEKKDFCENEDFYTCPRFVAHLDLLKAKSS